MNTLQSTAESRLDTLIVPQENPELEELWATVFCDEYKPEVEINFERIKESFPTSNVANLCDYMLSLDSTKKISISVLQSLSSNQKDILLDVFLEHPLEKTQEKCGLAMVYWLWYYSSSLNDKRREMFEKFWIKLEGKDRYILLEKARNAQLAYKRDIGLTLKQYIMFRNLYTVPLNDAYTKQTLGPDFSFSPLASENEYEQGMAKDWDWKHFDKEGKEISDDVFRNIFSSKVNESGRHQEVVNYNNPDIYKDFSGTQYKLYLDGPVGIGLMHKGKPVAVISFGLKNMDTIYIHQMQKVSVHKFDRFGRDMGIFADSVLQDMNWQELLYNDLITFASNCTLGIKKVEIKSAVNNEWIDRTRSKSEYSESLQKRIGVKTDKTHLSKDIAKKIYDNFATKHGFKKDRETKDWKRYL